MCNVETQQTDQSINHAEGRACMRCSILLTSANPQLHTPIWVNRSTHKHTHWPRMTHSKHEMTSLISFRSVRTQSQYHIKSKKQMLKENPTESEEEQQTDISQSSELHYTCHTDKLILTVGTNRVFLHCVFATFTSLKDLSTSSTAAL